MILISTVFPFDYMRPVFRVSSLSPPRSWHFTCIYSAHGYLATPSGEFLWILPGCSPPTIRTHDIHTMSNELIMSEEQKAARRGSLHQPRSWAAHALPR